MREGIKAVGIEEIKIESGSAWLKSENGDCIKLDNMQIDSVPDPVQELPFDGEECPVTGIADSTNFSFTCKLSDESTEKILREWCRYLDSIQKQYEERLKWWKEYQKCLSRFLYGRTKLIRKRNASRIRKCAKKAILRWGNAPYFINYRGVSL